MLGKIDKSPQLEIFKIPLKHFIKADHELILLSHRIDWEKLEQQLSIYYCTNNGRISIPIRKVAGVLILKTSTNYSFSRTH